MRESESDQELLSSVRQRQQRHQQKLRDGEPTLARQFARVGVLGWLIVTPTLIGVASGRWLDKRLGTGLFWTAPLLLLGLLCGCWLAWKWMHKS